MPLTAPFITLVPGLGTHVWPNALVAAIDREYLGYQGSERPLTSALADFCRDRFGWEIDPRWVRVVPDVVKGVAVAIDELTPAGSAIVIPTPSYHPFFGIPEAVNRPRVYVPMRLVDRVGHDGAVNQNWEFDLAALEDAFRDRPGSLILCNPYNPLGRAFSAEELRDVIHLADRYDVRVISDEIHAPVVFNKAHVPAASVSDTAANAVVTVIATSKGWNTAGLKCAQIIFTNPADREVMKTVPELRTGSSSTLGLVAAQAAYQDGREWLDAQLGYLSDNLDLLAARIPEVLPGAKFIRPEATYLLWLDVRDVDGLGDDPAKTLAHQARVAFSDGSIFGEGGAGHLRMNIATSREIISQALDRIAAATF